jgi:hypothetical protein
MIAALFALAAAMIIGGCAAVIQGFPYVRLESGLAMVIAGSVAASSGAVLLGLGVLALGFRRVERAIGRVPAPAGREAPGAASADESRARLPPILPAAPAFIVPSVVEPPFNPERPRIEPSLELRSDEIASTPLAAEPPKAVEPDPAPLFPMPPVTRVEPVIEPEPEPRPEAPQPARVIAPEDDLFAAPEEPSALKEEPPPLRPSLDTGPEPDPKPETRIVVGRYASGGNTYVMFEDGSIEAETPRGRFTFASLDELKAFVDGGGESGARGAA